MQRLGIALLPLGILLLLICLACLTGYVWMTELTPAYPLHKIIKKVTQLYLVLLIFPAMLVLRLNKADLGFAPRGVFFKQLCKGFGLGFITLMPVFILLTLLGVNVIDETQPWTVAWFSKKVVLELLLALLIGFFEESVFRGLLFAGLRKVFPVASVVLLSAFYYAILHFLSSSSDISAAQLSWLSGFHLLGEALQNLFDPVIFSALCALFMVGVYLGQLRSRYAQCLGLCIGCHASWVWQIKLNKSFFNTDFDNHYAYLVSHYDGVIGPLVTAWLLLAVIVINLRPKMLMSWLNTTN